VAVLRAGTVNLAESTEVRIVWFITVRHTISRIVDATTALILLAIRNPEVCVLIGSFNG
jgi:hypothetical protein